MILQITVIVLTIPIAAESIIRLIDRCRDR